MHTQFVLVNLIAHGGISTRRLNEYIGTFDHFDVVRLLVSRVVVLRTDTDSEVILETLLPLIDPKLDTLSVEPMGLADLPATAALFARWASSSSH